MLIPFIKSQNRRIQRESIRNLSFNKINSLAKKIKSSSDNLTSQSDSLLRVGALNLFDILFPKEVD